MSVMGCLPAELWHSILTFACTDGGYTGRALSLTSKSLHTLSCGARFHSLAFSSLVTLEGFLAYSRLPSHCGRKPRLVHLFVQIHESAFDFPPDLQYNFPTTLCREEKKRWKVRYLTSMHELLALAAPTLRSLTILEHHKHPLPPFLCPALPKLEELTTLHFSDALLPFVCEGDMVSTALPALRRLHCIATFPCSTPGFIEAITRSSPRSLTHLRLSGITTYSKDYARLPSELARVLGIPNVHTCTSAFARLPELSLPNLRHVVIHGFAPPAGCSPSSRDDAWDGFIADVQSLDGGRCRQDEGLRVLALGRPWRRDARWAERLRHDWLDRMDGGRGCWVMTEAEEEEEEAVLLL